MSGKWLNHSDEQIKDEINYLLKQKNSGRGLTIGDIFSDLRKPGERPSFEVRDRVDALINKGLSTGEYTEVVDTSSGSGSQLLIRLSNYEYPLNSDMLFIIFGPELTEVYQLPDLVTLYMDLTIEQTPGHKVNYLEDFDTALHEIKDLIKRRVLLMNVSSNLGVWVSKDTRKEIFGKRNLAYQPERHHRAPTIEDQLTPEEEERIFVRDRTLNRSRNSGF